MTRLQILVLAGCCHLLGATLDISASEPASEEFFEKQVRPLLVAKCLECHGDEEPEGDLKLTSRNSMLKGGRTGPAVVVHKSRESLLVKAILQTSRPKMPPDEKLSDSEIAILTKWVDSGLVWPDAAKVGPSRQEMVITEQDRQHWSYRQLVNVPPAKVRNTAWVRNPIDQFLLAKLEEAALTPSVAADRRTLLRRAYYDLIGLPPSWDDVQAFINDPAETPVAFAKVVDQLLDSPRYGERWARHWLDVARFADTKDGVLMYGDDRVRPYAYTYRDYVIRAFNEDLPFDRFVHEQLAADLIEPAVEPWRLAAMGFLTLGRMYDNNLHDIIDDQIDTVSRGFLGLTVSCARCHDHKYDSIPTSDYYSLYGVFASSEVPLELPYTDDPANTVGGIEFEKEASAKRAELLKFRDQQYELLSEVSRQRVGDYLVRVATTKPDPLETAIFFLSLAPEDLRPPIVARWRKYVEQHAQADDPVFGPWQELMEIPEPPLTPESTLAAPTTQTDFETQAREILERWKLRPAGTQPGHLNSRVKEGLSQAKLNSRTAVAQAYGEILKKAFSEVQTGLPATDSTSSVGIDLERNQLREILAGPNSPGYFPKNQTRRYMSRAETDSYGGKVQELDRMAVKSSAAPPRAMVVQDLERPLDPQIFVRGNPTQLGRNVPRQFLEILSGSKRRPFEKGSGRLELAKSITAPGNPLVARVLVNRVWMYHFGEPLVSTPSDFGKRSSPPTHPELLDHLAIQFIQDGWSLKKLHRRIMATSAYQQASAPNPHARTIDPDNHLLWSARRQRLDYEAMRDTLLAISGRLQDRLGGRPVEISNDPQSRVRTIYGLIDRQSLPGTFRAFDFATPDQSVERRPRTMVPQQALFAINSPFVIVQAKALVARSEVTGQTKSADQSEVVARLEALYKLALSRLPSDLERQVALEFVNADKDEQSQLSAWDQLAQVLLSSNELMYVD